ncbi:MAG: hypothetical protein ACLR0U_05035 [Enterocloster clostridioformis]
MQNDISVAALCLNLEQKLMEVWNNELTLERYRKVLAEFTVFAGNSSYSQSLGADFLIARFTEREGSFPQMNTPGRRKRISGACGCLQNTTTLALSTDGMIFLVKSSGQGHSVNVQKGF